MSEHVRTGQTTSQLGFTPLARTEPAHLEKNSGHGVSPSKFDRSVPFWHCRSAGDTPMTVLWPSLLEKFFRILPAFSFVTVWNVPEYVVFCSRGVSCIVPGPTAHLYTFVSFVWTLLQYHVQYCHTVPDIDAARKWTSLNVLRMYRMVQSMDVTTE